MTDPMATAEAHDEGHAAVTRFSDRVIAIGCYSLLMVSVVSFAAVAYIKIHQSLAGEKFGTGYESWISFLRGESSSLTLFVIGVVAAALGKQLLTAVRLADARTIPYDDLPLIRQAVIDGKPDPIDMYVRLRSLSGASGTFTKLGVTGLPLATIFLTLVFSGVSLMPGQRAEGFLDLAKLTLGAFIGSFVQRQVEQRKQEQVLSKGSVTLRPDLPT
jgi:hypothetical protein